MAMGDGRVHAWHLRFADVARSVGHPLDIDAGAALLTAIAYLYARCINTGVTCGRSALLGLLCVLLAAMRSTDVLAALPFCVHLAWRDIGSTRRSGGPWRPVVARGGFLVGTGVLAAVAFVELYLAIYGWNRSEYIAHSARFGLHSSMIPFRFYTLFIDPVGFYGDGKGIIERWPMVAIGLIALAYCVVFVRRFWAFPAAALGPTGIYLSYPDFLPENVWRYNVIHYLKWTFPVMALCAVVAGHDLWRRRTVSRFAFPIALGLASVLIRYNAVALPASSERDGADALSMDLGHPALVASLRVTGASGAYKVMTAEGPHRLYLDGQEFDHLYDFKTLQAPNGTVYVVLNRPRDTRRLQLIFADGIKLAPDASMTAMTGEFGLRVP